MWHTHAGSARRSAVGGLHYAAASLSPAIPSGLALAVVIAVLAGSPASAAGGSGGASSTGGAEFVATPDVLAGDDHAFPIQGKYSFGSSGSGFGSGRAGHSHQGHDVFARCGTPLLAARGGTVQRRARHPLSGNYLVIDGEGTDLDYAYMHMARRSRLREGDTVATGERIGAVGDSGNARGCHLHFELWSAPGYYEGGDPFDPLPALKLWDP